MVSIQSSNGYLFLKVYYFTVCKWLPIFVLYVLKQCLSGLKLIRAHCRMLYCSQMFYWIDALSCCCLKHSQCSSTLGTLKRNFNSCSSKNLKKRQKSHRINNRYAINKKFSRQLPIVPHRWKIITCGYNVLRFSRWTYIWYDSMKVHQNSVFAISFYTNLHFQTYWFFWPANTLITTTCPFLCIILALQKVCQFSF